MIYIWTSTKPSSKIDFVDKNIDMNDFIILCVSNAETKNVLNNIIVLQLGAVE